MDGITIQYELQQVRDRLSTLINRPASSPLSHGSALINTTTTTLHTLQNMADIQQNFTDQMEAIQARIAALDEQVPSRQEVTPPEEPKLEIPELDCDTLTLAPHTDRTSRYYMQPPGPSTASTMRALRQAVYDLDRRVASSEHELSEVKAGRNQSQYTPSSSGTSTEEPLRTLDVDVIAHFPFDRVTGDALSKEDQDVLPEAARNHADLSSHAWPSQANNCTACVCKQGLSHVECTHDKPSSQMRKVVEDLQRTAQDNNVSTDNSVSIISQSVGRSSHHTELTPARDSLHHYIHAFEQQHHKDISDLYKVIIGMQVTHNPRSEQRSLRPFMDDSSTRSIQHAAESLAFRDQEISRLNELLRITQEQLSSIEQHIAKEDRAVDVLASKHGQRNASTDNILSSTVHKHYTLLPMQRELAAKEVEIGQLQSMLDHRNDLIYSWTHRYQQLEQELRDCQVDRTDAVQHTKRLARALREVEKRRHDHAAGRAEEIDQLHDFCRDKDTIADKQEAIIARGAALLEQRDDEIEELSKKLVAVERERDDEYVRNDELATAGEEAIATLTSMKRQIASICERPKTFAGFGTQAMDLQTRLEDVKRAVGLTHAAAESASSKSKAGGTSIELDRAGDSSHPEQMSGSCTAPLNSDIKQTPNMWSPQPIAGLNNLTDEARPASVWTSTYSPPVFGQPGLIGSFGRARGRRGAATSRRGTEMGVQRGAHTADDKWQPLGPHDEDVAPSRTSTYVVRSEADPAPAPPSALPAWASPDNLLSRPSNAELRRKQTDRGLRSISRHESVPELRRKLFHAATVESDPESKGGEY